MLLPVTLLIAAIGAWLLSERGRIWLLGAALAVVFAISWPPVAWLAAYSLERGYAPRMPPAAGPAEAVVVLSGYMGRNDWGGPETPGLDTYERLLYAHALHRHWPELPIAVTGGRLLGPEQPPVAAVMKADLVRRGVPEAAVLVEPRARNTHENARFTAELLRPRGIRRVALVTHATHMPRAEASFAKQGLEVVPAPCCFASRIDEWDLDLLIPRWYSQGTVEAALHEWLGRALYRARGWL